MGLQRVRCDLATEQLQTDQCVPPSFRSSKSIAPGSIVISLLTCRSLGTRSSKYTGGSDKLECNGTFAVSPAKSGPFWETRTFKEAESRVAGTGTTSFLVTGRDGRGSPAASCPWFLKCILPTGDTVSYRNLSFNKHTVSCRMHPTFSEGFLWAGTSAVPLEDGSSL